MALVGTDLAWAQMAEQGWVAGRGLGSRGQGITEAIKPKLKFDQAGVGHSKSEEFEFHWWDHVFNKAAKQIKVDDTGKGDVRVEYKMDKADLSTKKLRRKARKKVRSQLYSNFVSAGTLTGGKMEGGETADTVEEVRDESKLTELTDEQLVAACGGRTAHKGGRHGLNMQAKLDRIEQAEREFMEKYGGKTAEKVVTEEDEPLKKKKKKSKRAAEESEGIDEVEEFPKKKSKKHSKHSRMYDADEADELTRKKKKKKHKCSD